jgi:hypothetical protein
MKLTSKQLQENYQKLIDIIDDTFVDTDDNERHTKLREMYDHLEDRIVVAPASGKEHYHYSFAGGYVLHILHIVDISKQLSVLYKKMGGTIDFTEEELVFSALHHDFGKLGDLDHEYYIPNDDDWRRKKLGEIFTNDPNINNMRVPDRALWLLQHFGIKCSIKETLGIKLADGMYDDANPFYLKVFDKNRSLKTSLPHIIHWADAMSTWIEYDEWKQSLEEEKVEVKQRVENIKRAASSTSQDLFDELFGDKK